MGDFQSLRAYRQAVERGNILVIAKEAQPTVAIQTATGKSETEATPQVSNSACRGMAPANCHSPRSDSGRSSRPTTR